MPAVAETDVPMGARIPWKITGNKIERNASVRLGHLRGYIPEQPDLIDFLTFMFKKWSSLDLGINKLTKPPLRNITLTKAYLYFSLVS